MVHNHGSFSSPKDRVVGPFPNGHPWLINGGDPNHGYEPRILSGMILQVCPSISFIFNDRLSAADRGSKPWNGSAQKAVTVLEQVGVGFFRGNKKRAEMPKPKKHTIEINYGFFWWDEKKEHQFYPISNAFEKENTYFNYRYMLWQFCDGDLLTGWSLKGWWLVTNPTHRGNKVGSLIRLNQLGAGNFFLVS